MRNEPPYPITSVDNALHLAALLQQEGPLRVSDAAELLGVSVSTAHRLLAMLVYRGFAEQRSDRRYQAGDVLRPIPPSTAPVTLLRHVALPHLRELMDQVQESVNLIVLAGIEARFVETVECSQILRVGSRAGRTVPAHLSSGGRAILAEMPSEEISARYNGAEDVDLTRLRRDLAVVRKRGFAINDQRTEAGLTAVGAALHDASAAPIAAVAIAMPSARFERNQLPRWVRALSVAGNRIEEDLHHQH
jgi:IclR family transcriptional regulator, acetate operon repressor